MACIIDSKRKKNVDRFFNITAIGLYLLYQHGNKPERTRNEYGYEVEFEIYHKEIDQCLFEFDQSGAMQIYSFALFWHE